jgi:hypothetical protein
MRAVKMNVTKALKKILEDNPYMNMAKLNHELGYGETKNAAATRLGRKTMSLELLIKFADVLNYDVVLIPKKSHEYALNEYVLTSSKSESGEPE